MPTLRVLGQWEGLSQVPLTLDLEGSMICMALAGPDGNAYATLTSEQARSIADMLTRLAQQAEARNRSVQWEDDS